ncbi:MAG: cation acetate symporter [Deinococcota bacterium]|jgi:cation/acetate symporter|nr:cation acetate symporter [Deinococcota bacterium]
MSVEVWTWSFIILTLIMYGVIAWRTHVTDISGFYVAGRGVPAVANGMATAADWMSAASFISMAGLIAFLGYDGTVYLMGWTGGYVLLALLLAPYLRKYGKYTVPDFIGDRYYSNTARAVAAVATLFISLTYISGQMRGVGIVLSRYLGVDIATGIIVALFVVAFIGVVGGMKAITYTQVAQYTVLIAAYLITAIAIANLLTGNPIPQLALTFTDIAGRLSAIQVDLGLTEYIAPFQNFTMIQVFTITLALMVGTAGLPHVIVRFYTVPSASAARWSAGWALLFISLLYTTAPAIAVFAKYNLINTLSGQPIEEVRQINWVDRWERTGLLTLQDLDGDGIVDFNEVRIDRDIIVLSTPEVAQLAPFVIALVAAGGLAAALSTADGLLIAMSSSVSHDIYYRILRPTATQAQRLLVSRIVIVVAAVIAAYLGIRPPGFVAEVVAFAFGLAAASLFPVILLGIFDKRMNREGAIAGILTGLIFTMVMIVLQRSNLVLGTEAPLVGNFLGINAQGIGVVGMVLNFIVAFAVSRSTPPPPAHIQEMIESIRVPKGSKLVTDEE